MYLAGFIFFVVALFVTLVVYRYKRRVFPLKDELRSLPLRRQPLQISNRTRAKYKRQLKASRRPYEVQIIGRGWRKTVLYIKKPK